MFFIHLLFALCTALMISAIFMVTLRRKGPWIDFLTIFVIVFLASWAGGIWLHPVGSLLWGVYWLPFLMVGLIFSLLIGALVSSRPCESTVEVVDPKKRERERKTAVLALGVFFWILVLGLIIAIILHYV